MIKNIKGYINYNTLLVFLVFVLLSIGVITIPFLFTYNTNPYSDQDIHFDYSSANFNSSAHWYCSGILNHGFNYLVPSCYNTNSSFNLDTTYMGQLQNQTTTDPVSSMFWYAFIFILSILIALIIIMIAIGVISH